MGSGLANVWVRSADGELFRADVLVHLRCRDGVVEATGADGRSVPLTECDCPPDFHLQLLFEFARVNLDDRWIVLITPEVTAEGPKWLGQRRCVSMRSARHHPDRWCPLRKWLRNLTGQQLRASRRSPDVLPNRDHVAAGEHVRQPAVPSNGRSAASQSALHAA
jgi:hypothetical protein